MKGARPGTEAAMQRYMREFARDVKNTQGDTVIMNFKRFRWAPFLMHESIHFAITQGKTVHVVWQD